MTTKIRKEQIELITIKNTSGATADAGDVGYMDFAGEYKTTTTAGDLVGWVAVVTGGADNADIQITTSGRITLNYAGSAPSAGDYLTTSTTAGSVLGVSDICSEAVAVAIAGGAGGTVSALLTIGRKFIPIFGADIYKASSLTTSDFVALINGAPSGTSVVYDTISSGDEANLVPTASTQLGKLVLHNTTRGDDALISDCNTGTNTITLTDTVPAAWANNDAITIRSQTMLGTKGSAYFMDIDISSGIPTEIITMYLYVNKWEDSGGVGQEVILHSYKDEVDGTRIAFANQVAGVKFAAAAPTPMVGSRFTMAWTTSGANTGTLTLRNIGGWVLEA